MSNNDENNYQDIKVLKNANDMDPDNSFVISLVTYENEHGGKVLQSLYLSEKMFNRLVFRVNQAKGNYLKGRPETESETEERLDRTRSD